MVLYKKHKINQPPKNSIVENERWFQTLFYQFSTSIYLLSFSRNRLIIEDANDAFLIQVGYSRDELTGKPLSLLYDKQTSRQAGGISRRLKAGETLSFEGSHVRKDGSTFSVNVSARLIRIGKKTYVLAIDHDITERKRAEEHLKKQHERLESLVKERAVKLSQANKNLKVEIGIRKRAESKLLDYQKQLQLLTSQMSLIEEKEKRRIATELHDCIGQTLALSKIKLGMLNRSAPSPEFKDNIREILNLIEQTIKETRTLTFELSPPILYELGLTQAIKWLIDQFREKHGINIIFIDDGHNRQFDNNTRFFIFQSVRELLMNVVKHAKATCATITMKADNGCHHLTLEDDGIGFSIPSVNYEGYGLFNIRERMNHIKGEFKIKSVPGRGTRVTLVTPLIDD